MPSEVTIPMWPVYVALAAVAASAVMTLFAVRVLVPVAKWRAHSRWGSSGHYDLTCWFAVALIAAGPIGWWVAATRGPRLVQNRKLAKVHGVSTPNGPRAWDGMPLPSEGDDDA